MRRILLACVLTFAACASRDGFIDSEVHDCESGDVEIRAGFDPQSAVVDQERHTFLVEVANNSDEEITVDLVRVDPMATSSGYEITGGAVQPKQVIAEGDDGVFEVPITIRPSADDRFTDPRRGFSGAVDVSVSVVLSGGESYRCRFRVPVE